MLPKLLSVKGRLADRLLLLGVGVVLDDADHLLVPAGQTALEGAQPVHLAVDRGHQLTQVEAIN